MNILKDELQEMENKKDMLNANKYFAKCQLEGERPTKFFCNMNKKMKARAQFKEVYVKELDEKGEEKIRIVNEQSAVEWEFLKFY